MAVPAAQRIFAVGVLFLLAMWDGVRGVSLAFMGHQQPAGSPGGMFVRTLAGV